MVTNSEQTTRLRGNGNGRYRLRVIVPAFPALNVYSYIAKRTTALGPICVATSANQMPQWEAEVIDENNLGRHGPRDPVTGANHTLLQQIRPADVVGFYGGLTSVVPRLYELARFYKELGAVVIAGGQHFVDENIDEALDKGLDYVVCGEAEDTIVELLKVLQDGGDAGTVNGIAFRRNGSTIRTTPRPTLTEFEHRPLPDFSLVKYARIKFFPVERIRGCGMECEFCTVKGRPRPASPERLLRQIVNLSEKFNAQHFFIVDDLFGQQREETLRLCAILKDYQQSTGKRFNITVQIRLDKARDSELLFAMRKAGVEMVCIGFESPVDEDLVAMNKHIRSHEMLTLARIYHTAGFLVHGMFIFGYPSENSSTALTLKQRVKRFRSFVKKAKLDTVQVLLPVPLPGTLLRGRLLSQKRIYPNSELGWEFYDGNFPLFEPDNGVTAEATSG